MILDLGICNMSAFNYLTLCALVVRLDCFQMLLWFTFVRCHRLLMHVAIICRIRVLYSRCSNVGLMKIWFGQCRIKQVKHLCAGRDKI